MQNRTEKRVATGRLARAASESPDVPSEVERAFACQLATSVWLRQLADEDANTALSDYVRARCRDRQARAQLRVVLEGEYRLCRERLDLCS